MLEHAVFIALFRQVSPKLDGTWRVGSEHDTSTTYRVRLDAAPGEPFCSCQHSIRHKAPSAKHSLCAVMFSRALLGLERHTVFDEAPAPTLITRLAPISIERVAELLARYATWHATNRL